MPRDIPVGNGSLLVTFDRDYCLRDIYYPKVGRENHTDGHKFRFGVWADGMFSWVNSADWNLLIEYAEDTLFSHVTALNEGLGISLHCNDCVDYHENIYFRTIQVRNLSGRSRDVRIFFHHDFHILESATGDTAYYDPDEKAVIHYKANRYFLVSGIRSREQGIDQYAAGVKEFHGLEGTWKDAEDGRLEGGPIAQGSVDSCIAFHVRLGPEAAETVHYWICAGLDYAGVSGLNRMVVGHGIDHFLGRTDSYWRAWVTKEKTDLSALPSAIADLFRKSLLILRTNIDAGGAIIAGNDSDVQHFARDTYSYMWPRDGALTAYALDRAGYAGVTRRFFDFCLSIIGRGKESVGYFLHKYNPDGSLGSSWHPWVADRTKILPIQEDGTALVIWALWRNFEQYRDADFILPHYEKIVLRCGDFLASYRDAETGLPLPSYDLWEERWGIHAFTVSTVYAGLEAAAKFCRFFGNGRRARIYEKACEEVRAAIDSHLFSRTERRFLRSLIPGEDGRLEPDPVVDASVYAPFYFGVFPPDDERVVSTMEAVNDRLRVRTDVGGIARYEGDRYHRPEKADNGLPGNPWFICTLWLCQWQIARAKTETELAAALPILEWVASRALPSGVLAEQIDPYTNRPLSVAPLTWSHAAFVSAVIEYLEKRKQLHACPHCGGQVG